MSIQTIDDQVEAPREPSPSDLFDFDACHDDEPASASEIPKVTERTGKDGRMINTTASTAPILSAPADHILGLHPNHLADLRRSGLTDATIKAAGLRSESDCVKLAGIINAEFYKKSMGSALVFPYFDANGQNGYSRIKPDRPRKDHNGKLVKYEAPRDTPNQMYLPPGVADVLQDGGTAIILTEGEKKALAATQEGFPCIGMAGVFGWKPRNKEKLNNDLNPVAWKGRKVYIAFDSDIAENENIQDAESRLASQLIDRGAIVRVVRIPAGPVGADGKAAKMGLDDLLVAHGPNFKKVMRGLLDAAGEPEEVDTGHGKPDAKQMDAAPTIQEFLETYQQDAVSRLMFWRGQFHFWKHGAYREINPADIRSKMIVYLNERFRKLTMTATSNALDQLKAQSILPSDIEPPAWIGEAPTFKGTAGAWDASDCLVAKNGIVHLQNLVGGDEYFHKATPAFFTTNALDYDFQRDAAPPMAWLAFLNQVWEGDADSIRTLQEWFGYCLTLDTRQQKMILLLGPKRSGKGTIARILAATIGPKNCCGPTLASLSTNFGLSPLLGKSVAIINDARLSGRVDGAVVVERLLSITGEDAQTVDRKFLDAVTAKLSTRMMIISNELPRLSDTSGALASRMVVLRMTKSFYGHEDHGLTDKLLGELPGILLWSIEGWRRLRERGYFQQPQSANDMADAMADLASPVGAFVRERCDIGPEFSVRVSAIYQAWEEWCKEKGRREPGTEGTFGRDLLAAVPTLSPARQHREGSDRFRSYKGIQLR